MIPTMNASRVLPPYIGEEPGNSAEMSPYRSDMAEVVHRFGHSLARVAILRGLLSYRGRLRQLGLVDGHQWLDGSFVEDVEAVRGRAPNDIDIITFASVPGTSEEKLALISENLDIFDSESAKETHRCDAYFVDLSVGPLVLVDRTRYWFGLFSHQRETSLWKGMVQVTMASDDAAAAELLNEIERELEGVQNAQEA